MSSFYCDKCGKAILDSPGGNYTTGCEHFPLPNQPTPESKREVLDDLPEHITKEVWDKIEKEGHKCDENCGHTEKHITPESKEERRQAYKEGSKSLEEAFKPESKDRQGFEIQEDGSITTESKDWKVEFRERFKNPKNTGYRVGQEFLGAIEVFIADLLRSEKDIKPESKDWEGDVREMMSNKLKEVFPNWLGNYNGSAPADIADTFDKIIDRFRSEKKKSEEFGYNQGYADAEDGADEAMQKFIDEKISQAKEEMKKDLIAYAEEKIKLFDGQEMNDFSNGRILSYTSLINYLNK